MLFGSIFKNCFKLAKFYQNAQKAIEGIRDGSTILIGGIGFCGVPMNLLSALRRSGARDLTVVSNACGLDSEDTLGEWGINMLVNANQIKRLVFSYMGENRQVQRRYFMGKIELQVVPMGTLAQRIRSGGAGVPAFYTQSGIDTLIEDGGIVYKFGEGTGQPEIVSPKKTTKMFKGKKYILEESIMADYALIKAQSADTLGNLSYHKAAKNFNKDMAMAAKCVIAEAEEIVLAGRLNPEFIDTPQLYVDRTVKSDPHSIYSEKVIEKLTLRDHNQVKKNVKAKSVQYKRLNFDDSNQSQLTLKDIKDRIAARAVKELQHGMKVSLGVGIPSRVARFASEDMDLTFQSENGVLGVGPFPTLDEVDPDNVNASRQTITVMKGAVYFSSSESFSMMRGAHLDLSMMGALQISSTGDIANWSVPGKMINGMGGAMDLVSSGMKIVVLMKHTDTAKDGSQSIKLVSECTMPLTARKAADKVITELAVFERREGKLVLTQLAKQTTLEQVQAKTGFTIETAKQITLF